MKLIECPRDAMQGIHDFIPTELKAKYINALLKVGFDTIDFGSFVSPKAIPQLKDTSEVLDLLDIVEGTNLLAIVANERGARDALDFEEIDFIGFPLSISETFQRRNTNRSIEEAIETVSNIQNECEKRGRKLVVYLSMGFGNPYGDHYSEDLVLQRATEMKELGVETLSLADTIGSATPEQITSLLHTLTMEFSTLEIGAHLHAIPESSIEKIRAVFSSGCQRVDAALGGYGGCPMAKDELTGNIDTEVVMNELTDHILDLDAFNNAKLISQEIFTRFN